MSWQDDVIRVHTNVSDKVSHIERMKSDRYFVWEEDDRVDLIADNKHIEKAIVIVTDLFTKHEFDSWVDLFSDSLDAEGYSWGYEFVERETDTGIFHHQWTWIYNG